MQNVHFWLRFFGSKKQNSRIYAVLLVYVTGTLMPKYGGAAAFTTAAFFQELWLFCGIICGNYAQYGLMSAAMPTGRRTAPATR